MDYQVGVTPCPQCGSSDQVRTARQLFDMMNGAAGFQQSQSQPFQQPAPFQQPQPYQGQQAYQQQPGGFGQPAPFGQQQSYQQQPGGFGQPAPFGQPEPFGQGTAAQPGAPLQQGTPFPQPDPSHPEAAPQSGAPFPPGQAGPPPGQAGQQQGQAGQPQGQAGQQQGQPGGWNNANDDDYDHYNAESNRSGFPFGRGRSRREGFGLDSLGDNLADDIGGAVVGAALGFAGRALAKRMKKAYDEKIAPAMEARAAQAQQQSQQSRADQDAIVARYPELRGCLADQVIFLDGGYKTVPVSELKLPVTLAQADAVVARLR